jgi:hypothetical protein
LAKKAAVPAPEVPPVTLSVPALAKKASRAALFAKGRGEKSVTDDARGVDRDA